MNVFFGKLEASRLLSLRFGMFCMGLLLLFTGCAALPVEAPILSPPLPAEARQREYRTVLVERGDVARFLTTNASLIPFQAEDLHFGLNRQLVTGIYVSTGDYVQAGDIIASVSRPYIREQKDTAIWKEQMARLSLRHLEERHAFALERAYILEMPVDDEPYITERARILHQINVLQMRIDYLDREYETQFLRASFDGIVIHAIAFNQGMHVSNFQIIASVINPADFVFGVLGEVTYYMHYGDEFDMVVNGESFTGIVINPDDYDVDPAKRQQSGFPFGAFLRLAEGSQPMIGLANFASVHVVMEAARNVLFVPNMAIEETQGRNFVYVMEDDTRVLRYVEIGVVGNTFTEIVSGLEAGEVVIIG